MFNKTVVKNCIRVILCILVILLVVAGIIAFILFTRTSHIPLIKGMDAAKLTHMHLWLRYALAAEVFLVVLSMLLMFFIIRGLSPKFLDYENSKDEMIIRQEKEIAKQRKVIDNLTELYNNLNEYDRHKTEFFSNISHELKTPLSVILGAIQLMEQKKSIDSSDQFKYSKHHQTIRHNCYQLLRLVNNTLDITRIDSGFIKFNPVNCNIVYLVEEIVQSVIPFAEQKKLTLEFDTETEEIITGVDEEKIERIILNLLSNAIKFTPEGGKISINICQRDKKVLIAVKDTGFGIPAHMQDIIFERFRQVNNKLTRSFEGSGIGLSLVKCFVELHSGNITLISEENRGSEFLIELPIRLYETDQESIPGYSASDSQNKINETIKIEFSGVYAAASRDKA